MWVGKQNIKTTSKNETKFKCYKLMAVPHFYMIVILRFKRTKLLIKFKERKLNFEEVSRTYQLDDLNI
jgi:hypothetical protein